MNKSQLDLYLEEIQRNSTSKSSSDGTFNASRSQNIKNSKTHNLRKESNHQIIHYFTKIIQFTTYDIIIPFNQFILESIYRIWKKNMEVLMTRWQVQSQPLILFLSGSLDTSMFIVFENIIKSNQNDYTISNEYVYSFEYMSIVIGIIVLLMSLWLATFQIIFLLLAGAIILFTLIPYIITALVGYLSNQLLKKIRKASIHSQTILNLLKSVQQASLSVHVSHPSPPIFALEKSLSKIHDAEVVFECETVRKSLQYLFYTFSHKLLLFDKTVTSYTHFFAFENSEIRDMETSRNLYFKTYKPVLLESFPSSSSLQYSYISIVKGILPITIAHILSLSFSGIITRPLSFKQMEDVHFSTYWYLNNHTYLRWLSCIYEGNITFFCHNYHCCLLVQLLSSVWLLCLSIGLLFECLTILRTFNYSLDQFQIPYVETEICNDLSYYGQAITTATTTATTTSLSRCYFDTRVDLLKSRRKYEQILLKLWLCEQELSSADMLAAVSSPITATTTSTTAAADDKSDNVHSKKEHQYDPYIYQKGHTKLQKVLTGLSGQSVSLKLTDNYTSNNSSGSSSSSLNDNDYTDTNEMKFASIKSYLHSLVTSADSELNAFQDSLQSLHYHFQKLSEGTSMTDVHSELINRSNRIATSGHLSKSDQVSSDTQNTTVISNPTTDYPFFEDQKSLLEFLASRADSDINNISNHNMQPIFKSVQEYLQYLDTAYKDEHGRQLVDVFVGSVPEVTEYRDSDALRKLRCAQRDQQRKAGKCVTEEPVEDKIMRELRVLISARSESSVERVSGDCNINAAAATTTIPSGSIDNISNSHNSNNHAVGSACAFASPTCIHCSDTSTTKTECVPIDNEKYISKVLALDSGVTESKSTKVESIKTYLPTSTQLPIDCSEKLSHLISCAATVDLARTSKSAIEQHRSVCEVSLGDSSDDGHEDDDVRAED